MKAANSTEKFQAKDLFHIWGKGIFTVEQFGDLAKQSSTMSLRLIIGTAIVGLVSYVVYFDYRRRSDPEFRKYLKKLDKEDRKIREEREKNSTNMDPLNERFFYTELRKAGELAQEGPSKAKEAARHYLNAVKVYPNPQEFLQMLQGTIPQYLFIEVIRLLQEELNAAGLNDLSETD